MPQLRLVLWDAHVRFQQRFNRHEFVSLRALLSQRRIWRANRHAVRLLPMAEWKRRFLTFYWRYPGWTPDDSQDHANDTEPDPPVARG